jgi:hypothetical protein
MSSSNAAIWRKGRVCTRELYPCPYWQSALALAFDDQVGLAQRLGVIPGMKG